MPPQFKPDTTNTTAAGRSSDLSFIPCGFSGTAEEGDTLLPHNPDLAATIVDEPADLTRRLVYADWLEEQGAGGPARLIRAQCRLANLNPCDDHAIVARVEAAFLARIYRDDLVRAAIERIGLQYAQYRSDWLFELDVSLGLPDDLRVKFGSGLRYLPALASLLPIARIAIECQGLWDEKQQRQALAGLTRFKPTTIQCWFDRLDYGQVFDLLEASPNTTGVRSLSVGAVGGGYVSAGKGLLESRRWDQVDVPVAVDMDGVAELESIHLRTRHLGLILGDSPGPVHRLFDRWGNGLEAVTYGSVGSRRLRGLSALYPDGHTIRSLAFASCALGPESARELLPPELFGQLHSLSVDDCVGAKGLISDGAKGPSRLRALRVGRCDLTGAAIARLLSASHPELAVLDLAGSPATTAAARALARNKGLTDRLASLTLRGAQVDGECVHHLSQAAWPRLVDLDVGATVPQQHLADLFNPERYPSLQSVSVQVEADLAEAVEDLRGILPRSGVRYLDLDCPVSARGVGAVLDLLPTSRLEYVLVNPGALTPKARADAVDRSGGRLRFC